MKNNSLNKELFIISKGAGFTFFGKIFAKVLTLGITVILTRVLGPALFGIYALGKVVLSFSASIASLGLDRASLKFIPRFRSSNNKEKVKGTIIQSALFSFGAGVFTALILWFFAEEISSLFKEPGLVTPLRFFSIGVPFFSLMSALETATRGFKTTKYSVLSRLVIRLSAQLLFIIIFIGLGYKLMGAILAYILGAGASIVALIYYFKKIFPDIFSRKLKPTFQFKNVFSTSIPLMYVGMLGFFLTWTDITMVGLFRPINEVGVYKIVLTVALFVSLFEGSFTSIFCSIISEYYYTKKLASLEKIFKTVSKWIFYLSLPISVAILLSPTEIIKIFGASFTEGVQPLIILTLAYSAQLISFGAASILAMTAYHNLRAIVSTIGVIINIILNFIFISSLGLGITGAAMATAITVISINLFFLLMVKIKLGIHPFSHYTLIGIVGSAIALIVGFGIKKFFLGNFHYLISLLVSSFISCSVLLVIFLKMGIEKQDKLIFKKILQKVKSKL